MCEVCRALEEERSIGDCVCVCVVVWSRALPIESEGVREDAI